MSFLAEGVNRPDLFTNSSVMFRNPKGYIPRSSNPSTLDTIIIIIGSAFVFITLFSYCDTLRSWLDSKFINESIKPQTKSRLVFSIIMTVITIIVCLIIYVIKKISNKKKMIEENQEFCHIK